MGALTCKSCGKITTAHEARRRFFFKNRCTCGGVLKRGTWIKRPLPQTAKPIPQETKSAPPQITITTQLATYTNTTNAWPSLKEFAEIKLKMAQDQARINQRQKELEDGYRREADRDRDRSGRGADWDSGKGDSPADSPACGGTEPGVIPLKGWKLLGVTPKGELYSPVIHGRFGLITWPHHQRFEAKCYLHRTDIAAWYSELQQGLPPHRAPAVGCTCGIYSATEALKAVSYGGTAAYIALAECYFWGKIQVYEYGYKAEYAYPKQLWVVDHGSANGIPRVAVDPAILQQHLIRNYGVPTKLRSFSQLQEFAYRNLYWKEKEDEV